MKKYFITLITILIFSSVAFIILLQKSLENNNKILNFTTNNELDENKELVHKNVLSNFNDSSKKYIKKNHQKNEIVKNHNTKGLTADISGNKLLKIENKANSHILESIDTRFQIFQENEMFDSNNQTNLKEKEISQDENSKIEKYSENISYGRVLENKDYSKIQVIFNEKMASEIHLNDKTDLKTIADDNYITTTNNDLNTIVDYEFTTITNDNSTSMKFEKIMKNSYDVFETLADKNYPIIITKSKYFTFVENDDLENITNNDFKTVPTEYFLNIANDNFTVTRENDYMISTNDNFEITTNDDFTVTTNDEVTVTTNDEVTVTTNDDTTVTTNNDVTVTRIDDLTVTTNDDFTVTNNYDFTVTESKDSTTTTNYDTTVTIKNDVTVTMIDNSTVTTNYDTKFTTNDEVTVTTVYDTTVTTNNDDFTTTTNDDTTVTANNDVTVTMIDDTTVTTNDYFTVTTNYDFTVTKSKDSTTLGNDNFGVIMIDDVTVTTDDDIITTNYDLTVTTSKDFASIKNEDFITITSDDFITTSDDNLTTTIINDFTTNTNLILKSDINILTNYLKTDKNIKETREKHSLDNIDETNKFFIAENTSIKSNDSNYYDNKDKNPVLSTKNIINSDADILKSDKIHSFSTVSSLFSQDKIVYNHLIACKYDLGKLLLECEYDNKYSMEICNNTSSALDINLKQEADIINILRFTKDHLNFDLLNQYHTDQNFDIYFSKNITLDETTTAIFDSLIEISKLIYNESIGFSDSKDFSFKYLQKFINSDYFNNVSYFNDKKNSIENIRYINEIFESAKKLDFFLKLVVEFTYKTETLAMKFLFYRQLICKK